MDATFFQTRSWAMVNLEVLFPECFSEMRSLVVKSLHSTEGLCCRRINAHQSFRPFFCLCGTNGRGAYLEYHGRILERRFGFPSTGTSTSSCGVQCCYRRHLSLSEATRLGRSELSSYRSNTGRHAPRVLQDWATLWKHSFQSATGNSQSDELGCRACHARAKKYADV